jgi:thiol-disulfide isomerase/thioredoxin
MRMNAFGSRRLAVAAAIVLAGVGATACTATQDAVDPIPNTQYRFTDSTPKGEVIPEADRKKPGAVTGELLDGKGTYSLSSDTGKVVVVNLWGSWCPPCQVETPQFQQVYLETKAQGVEFVGFAVKEKAESDTEQFVANNDITYPVVYDQAVKVALQLGRLPVQQGMPQTVMIDKQGRVAAAYVGIVQPSQLKPAIATLVAES